MEAAEIPVTYGLKCPLVVTFSVFFVMFLTRAGLQLTMQLELFNGWERPQSSGPKRPKHIVA